jgi:hypothetical protein
MNMLIQQVITREVGPGERLLWSGQPWQGIRMQRADLLLFPLGVMWFGFASLWEWSIIARGASVVFWLWGIPFLVVGLYIMLGRFFVDARQRAVTFYALTDKRIFIVSGVLKRQVKSLPLNSLSDLSITETNKGRGTITFGMTSQFTGYVSGAWWPGLSRYVVPTFEGIAEAQQVYALLREAQLKAS